ncbi:MAG: ribosomal protein S18-alanine N-acetyltransferase [Symbiobacteriia bacterium]
MVFEVSFERMSLDDLDGVMAVEHTAFVTPWSRRAFVTELTENAYAYYIVARVDGAVAGYGGMWLIIDEAHVTNIAVHSHYRGQGIGERLMLELIAGAKERGCLRMTLEVRRSNQPAQQLYSKLGFEPRGVRRGYYTDTREDAIVMWKDHL